MRAAASCPPPPGDACSNKPCWASCRRRTRSRRRCSSQPAPPQSTMNGSPSWSGTGSSSRPSWYASGTSACRCSNATTGSGSSRAARCSQPRSSRQRRSRWVSTVRRRHPSSSRQRRCRWRCLPSWPLSGGPSSRHGLPAQVRGQAQGTGPAAQPQRRRRRQLPSSRRGLQAQTRGHALGTGPAVQRRRQRLRLCLPSSRHGPPVLGSGRCWRRQLPSSRWTRSS